MSLLRTHIAHTCAIDKINLCCLLLSGLLWVSPAFASGNHAYDVTLLPKWNRVINAYYSSNSKAVPFTTIQKINNKINSYRYISDMENYGEKDHWATPEEFYTHDGGDCEDYAIAKNFRLIESGILAKDMQIVVGTKQDTQEQHAVLRMVYQGRVLYLDNNTNKITEETAYLQNFSPFFYANENILGFYIANNIPGMPVAGASDKHIPFNLKE